MARAPRAQNKVFKKREIDERDALNLTGSPLKDSCDYDPIDELTEPITSSNAWSDLEESYHPIKASQAQ